MQTISDIPHPPARPADAHKGTFGTVIVVGGSPTMIGAPAICATAALRTGVGLCKVAADPRVLPHILTIQPGATGIELRDDITVIDDADPGYRAVLAVGPGLGTDKRTGALIAPLIDGPHDLVLDADGLNLLAASGQTISGTHTRVLTPHPGEFRRLAAAVGIDADPTDPDQRPRAAAALAAAHGGVVVLKGQHTVVCDGQRVHVNQTGNPALATAGSGDVLTGIIAALMAQGMDAFDAAVLGVHVHGKTADLWAQEHGPAGLTAMDLAALLPKALRHHHADRQQ